MIGDAYVRVTCDNNLCGVEDFLELCALAGGGWAFRHLESRLKELGWLIAGEDTHYCCSECEEEAKAKAGAA
jgi:hypothetical protein